MSIAMNHRLAEYDYAIKAEAHLSTRQHHNFVPGIDFLKLVSAEPTYDVQFTMQDAPVNDQISMQ